MGRINGWHHVGYYLLWKKGDKHIKIKKDTKYAKYPYGVFYRQKSYSKGEYDALFYGESVKQCWEFVKNYMEKH
jgi:hypothetical protein